MTETQTSLLYILATFLENKIGAFAISFCFCTSGMLAFDLVVTVASVGKLYSENL